MRVVVLSLFVSSVAFAQTPAAATPAPACHIRLCMDKDVPHLVKYLKDNKKTLSVRKTKETLPAEEFESVEISVAGEPVSEENVGSGTTTAEALLNLEGVYYPTPLPEETPADGKAN